MFRPRHSRSTHRSLSADAPDLKPVMSLRSTNRSKIIRGFTLLSISMLMVVFVFGTWNGTSNAPRQVSTPVFLSNNPATSMVPSTMVTVARTKSSLLGIVSHGTAFDWTTAGFLPGVRKFWIDNRPRSVRVNFQGHHIYRRILISHGWIQATSPMEKGIELFFVSKTPPTQFWSHIFKPQKGQLVNHSPGEEHSFGDKIALLRLIQQYSERNGCDYSKLHPRTFLLEGKDDCESFVEIALKSNLTSLWFLKGSRGSGGGGIHVISMEEIIEAFKLPISELKSGVVSVPNYCQATAKEPSLNDTLSNRKFLQQAVEPLLIEGSKFDIRMYIVVSKFKPFTVYFRHGYLRRSLTKFHSAPSGLDEDGSESKSAHKDRSRHLTNTQMQSKGSRYDVNEHYWSMDRLRKYALGTGYTQDQVDQLFDVELKKIGLSAFEAIKDTLDSSDGYWVILGLDVMFNTALKPSLLEVNVNPFFDYDVQKYGQEHVNFFWKLQNELLDVVLTLHRNASADHSRVPDRSEWELIYDASVMPTFRYSTDVCYAPKIQKGLIA